MSLDRKFLIHIIDDDPDMLDTLSTIISEEGHEVITSRPSPTVVEQLLESPPDIVLTDLMMPPPDGMDILRALKAEPRAAKTRVVIVSAKAYEFDRKRALDFGADGFITKPVNAPDLLATLEHVFEDKVSVDFYGVRGTLPRSGPGTYRYGGNTSCVTMEFPKGETFIFDAGTGIKELGDKYMREGRRNIVGRIFISHPHWDHINALPFFTPLYMQGNEFEIIGAAHGDKNMRELIGAQMEDIYFPITMKEFGARVYFRNVKDGTFEVDQIPVTAMMLSHPGYCLGYRIDYNGRKIAYVTDNELYLKDNPAYNQHYVNRLVDYLKDVDVLITDTTYMDEEYSSKVHWGHSCIGEVVKVADAAGVKQLCLFHHDPDQNDDAIDVKLETSAKMLANLGSSVKVTAPAEGDRIKV
ncbi:MAG: response regulator [Magnetovibrionaceae bacterium]